MELHCLIESTKQCHNLSFMNVKLQTSILTIFLDLNTIFKSVRNRGDNSIQDPLSERHRFM